MFSTTNRTQPHLFHEARQRSKSPSREQEAYDEFAKTLGSKALHRFLMPENASLAQALLQVILDRACLKIMSSGKRGIAVMLFEDWQIDLLAGFEVISQKSSRESEERNGDDVAVNAMDRAEYLSIDQQVPTLTQPINDRSTKRSVPRGVGAYSELGHTGHDVGSVDWLSTTLNRDGNSSVVCPR